MQTKLFLKIWLLCVNFGKFTSINVECNQSQRFKALKFSGIILIVCIHYYLWKIYPQIIEWKLFTPYGGSTTRYICIGTLWLRMKAPWHVMFVWAHCDSLWRLHDTLCLYGHTVEQVQQLSTVLVHKIK